MGQIKFGGHFAIVSEEWGSLSATIGGHREWMKILDSYQSRDE